MPSEAVLQSNSQSNSRYKKVVHNLEDQLQRAIDRHKKAHNTLLTALKIKLQQGSINVD